MKRLRYPYPRVLSILLGLLITAMVLTACGGSTGSSGSDSEQSGELAVSLTDAEGDFASYTVDVVSLTLTRANGTEISTLPMSTRIDFAQYTDMAEFLTTATVPAGVYVAASLTLDYSNADIWVENASGDLVKAEAIVDETGVPISLVEVTVQLEDRNRLVIAPGLPMHLQLDFDLRATNTVTFDDLGAATVSVDPYLVADVNRVDDKIHVLRGLLDGVDPAESTFSVIIRPCYAALAGSHRRFGSMTVTTDSSTLYDLSGENYQGQDGLTAMQGLDPLSPVVVVGEVTFNPLRFAAHEVYAGTSVPWGDQDIVSGSVLARDGYSLAVKGATLVSSDGSVIFCQLATVTLSDETIVTRQFSLEPFSIDDISVGQRITAFGTLTDADPLNLALDAATGLVHLKLTTLRGSVLGTDNADPSAQLTMSLHSINQQPADLFDFSGTGVDSENDADPGDYAVNTSAMDISALGAGDPVKVRGFVQPYGAAPQDFNAWTIFSMKNTGAFLKVQWHPQSAEAFDSLSAEGLILNLDGAGHPHHVFRAWLLTDLTTLGQAPAVVPREDGSGLFILHHGGVVQVFVSFDDFSGGLASLLADGWLVQKIWARGDFDDLAATLTADLVDIHLK